MLIIRWAYIRDWEIKKGASFLISFRFLKSTVYLKVDYENKVISSYVPSIFILAKKSYVIQFARNIFNVLVCQCEVLE